MLIYIAIGIWLLVIIIKRMSSSIHTFRENIIIRRYRYIESLKSTGDGLLAKNKRTSNVIDSQRRKFDALQKTAFEEMPGLEERMNRADNKDWYVKHVLPHKNANRRYNR